MNDLQGEKGMAAVNSAVLDIGWIFRRQYASDYGVDGHIEITGDDGFPTGRLIAVQVKSGASFFADADAERIVFRLKARHADYWRRHALPVIVALHDPADDVVYWQAINGETLVSTGVGFKVDVPRAQRLDGTSEAALASLPERTPPAQTQSASPPDADAPADGKLARLAADKPLMQAIADGAVVRVLVDEWVNKSSGRGEFTIEAERDGATETLSEFMVLAKSTRYPELLETLFPWADVSEDDAYYDTFEDRDDDLDDVLRYGDPEDAAAYMEARDIPRIRPFSRGDEVWRYRLVLELNDVGRAFLTLDRLTG